MLDYYSIIYLSDLTLPFIILLPTNHIHMIGTSFLIAMRTFNCPNKPKLSGVLIRSIELVDIIRFACSSCKTVFRFPAMSQ